MTLFRPVFFAALLAGLIAGTVATVLHHVVTVPLILQSETYETGGANPPAGHAEHDHEAEAWAPEDGAERIAYTLGADLLTGIAYSILSDSGELLRTRLVQTG